LEDDIREILQRLTRIESKMEEVSHQFERIDKRLDRINSEMGSLDSRMDGLDRKFVAQEERYNRMIFIWKVATMFLAPIITTLIIYVIQSLL